MQIRVLVLDRLDRWREMVEEVDGMKVQFTTSTRPCQCSKPQLTGTRVRTSILPRHYLARHVNMNVNMNLISSTNNSLCTSNNDSISSSVRSALLHPTYPTRLSPMCFIHLIRPSLTRDLVTTYIGASARHLRHPTLGCLVDPSRLNRFLGSFAGLSCSILSDLGVLHGSHISSSCNTDINNNNNN
jgi:hypothetical protein